MLKHNVQKKVAVAVLAAMAILFEFTAISCKSTSNLSSVEPIELLSVGADAYFSIPVKSNFDFSKKLVESVASDGSISEKDVVRILERVDTIYAGMNLSGSAFEMSASGNFPVALSKFFLTEKNGWKNHKFSSYKYNEHMDSGLALSFLSSDLVCISSSPKIVEGQLGKCDAIISKADVQNVSFETSDSDICFFFPKAADILSMIVGDNAMLLSCFKSAYGSLRQVPGSEDFDLKLTLSLADPRTRMAVSGILRLAFLGTSVGISSAEDSVTLTGLLLDWNSIFSLVASSGAM